MFISLYNRNFDAILGIPDMEGNPFPKSLWESTEFTPKGSERDWGNHPLNRRSSNHSQDFYYIRYLYNVVIFYYVSYMVYIRFLMPFFV